MHNGEIPRFARNDAAGGEYNERKVKMAPPFSLFFFSLPKIASFRSRATRGKESVLMHNSQCIMHNGEMPHSVRKKISVCKRIQCVPTNYSLYSLNFNAFNKRFGNGFCGSRPLSFRANHFVNGILYASVNSISVPPMSSM